MAKVKIEELKYIVMEGGGARGTAYLGAVKALEKQLKNLVEADKNNKYCKAVVQDREKGIMDYLIKENDVFVPIIKGLSGGSAGAITTFCIMLGLNSNEIETVLNYPFEKFLTDIDPGKYRMIDSDSKLKVAMDEDDIYGGKIEDFKYDLTKDKTHINKNTYLTLKRKFIFNLSVKVICDGLASNIDQLLNMFSKNKSNDTFSAKIQKIFTDALKIGGKATKYTLSLSLYSYVSSFFVDKLRKKLGMNIQKESLITLFTDNGVFSGFPVREFFYDIILYAATRDTYFQKQMLIYYSDKQPFKDKDISKLFKKNTAYFKDFELGGRSKTFKKEIDFGKETYDILNQLQNITFRELWEITGIEFAVAVSNYTAGKPLYFSDIYTPHFRVLESVAASMNIPPIKPILNASNVFINKNISRLSEISETKKSKDGLDDDLVNFNDKKVKLSENLDAYSFYEYKVKKYLQEELRLDNDTGNQYVDVNNNIDLHTFLPKLMQLVIGRKYDKDTGKLSNDRILDEKKAIADEYKDVNYDILKFYYNAQYKGLLIDGGYYNNIPYNYFRDNLFRHIKDYEKRLEGVLAIKLDNQYPADFIAMLNKKYEKYFIKIADLEERIEDDLISTIENTAIKITNINSIKLKNDIFFRSVDKEYNKLIELVKNDIYKIYLTKSNETQKSIDKKAILNVISAMVKSYKNNKATSWLKKKSILTIALEGYSFGAERAQVRDIGDNNHIIPLYSYGVGTFDFDLKKVNPMAKMAQVKAEKDVNNYFSN